MLAFLSVACSVALSAYLIVEGLRGRRQYQQLQAELAAGTPGARLRFYREGVRFELLTGALAAVALGLHGGLATTGLEGLDVLQRFSVLAGAGMDFWIGFFGALVVGAVVATLAARRSNQRPAQPRSRLARWLLPDFDAMLPRSGAESRSFVLLALSAGVCEELVFRGWLLLVLQQTGLVHGLAMLIVAAVIFGAMHAYQGPMGVLSTSLLAVVFIGLTVSTGSLLIPMVLHAVIDLRWALPKREGQLTPAGAR